MTTICSIFCNRNGALSSFVTYYWVCCSIFSFLCNVVWITVCHFVLFLLSIVLSVFYRFPACDWPFSILKLFLRKYFKNEFTSNQGLQFLEKSIYQLRKGKWKQLSLSTFNSLCNIHNSNIASVIRSTL